jgi:P-type E1-E2 ATPase
MTSNLPLASTLLPRSFIILKYLDMITIAVPPALPACLTVATAIAVARLQQHDIFVSNPSAVALAGHLNVLCFDKTGTLTEAGLDLQARRFPQSTLFLCVRLLAFQPGMS